MAGNHHDLDLTVPHPDPMRLSDMTLETAPPGPTWPSRTIIRWKNVVPKLPAGSPYPGFGDWNHTSFVIELWGDDCNCPPVNLQGIMVDGRSRVVVVRQEIHEVTTTVHNAQVGIGAGPLGPGVCVPIPFWTLWGFPPLGAAPFDALHMDATTFPFTMGFESQMLSNLAVVFDPLLNAPPGTYAAHVY